MGTGVKGAPRIWLRTRAARLPARTGTWQLSSAMAGTVAHGTNVALVEPSKNARREKYIFQSPMFQINAPTLEKPRRIKSTLCGEGSG